MSRRTDSLSPNLLTLTGTGSDAQASPFFQPLNLIRPAYWHPAMNRLDLGDRQARTFFASLYPREASTNFLADFMHLPTSHRISLWVVPVSSDKAIRDLNREMQRLQATANATHRRGQVMDAFTPQAYQDAEELRRRIATQETKMYEMSLLVSLTTEGAGPFARADLEEASRAFLREAQGGMWEFRSAWLEQGSAFLSTLPLGRPTVTRPRPLDSLSLACTFALTSADVLEPGGVSFGFNQLTGKPILLNLADTRLYPAPHMVVIAKTRSGKSMLIKFYIIQRRMLDPDVSVMVLDPSKTIDYQPVSETLGTYVRLRPGTSQRLNVCDIAYPANLANLDPEDRMVLTNKVDYLRTLLYLMAHPEDPKGTWDAGVRPYISQVIKSVYTARGITDDPLSLVDPTTLHDSVPRLKVMPTLADLQQAFAAHANADMRAVAPLLEEWITGPMNVFNGQTNIRSNGGDPDKSPLEQAWITFNIEGLIENHPDRQHVVHFIIGEIMAQRMMESRRKKIIVLDEAHILFSNQATALWVSRLYRMAAKVNTQVVLITQSLGDMIGLPGQPIPGSEYARICLQSSYLKVLMFQDADNELELLAKEFTLDRSLTEFLQRAKQGEALIITHRFRALTRGKGAIPRSIEALITSNPDELKEEEATYVDPLAGRTPRPAIPQEVS